MPNSRNFVVWCLALALVITSIAVVQVRHKHRLAYVQYMANETERDALNDEWGQLLVEENLWSSAHRIEKHAGEQLKMRAPKKDEVEIIGRTQSTEAIAGVKDATR